LKTRSTKYFKRGLPSALPPRIHLEARVSFHSSEKHQAPSLSNHPDSRNTPPSTAAPLRRNIPAAHPRPTHHTLTPYAPHRPLRSTRATSAAVSVTVAEPLHRRPPHRILFTRCLAHSNWPDSSTPSCTTRDLLHRPSPPPRQSYHRSPQIYFTTAVSCRHHTGTRFTDVQRTGIRSLSPSPAASDPLHRHRRAWNRICFPHAHVNHTKAVNGGPRPASRTLTTNAAAATSSTYK
jgi:hypothetical protein